MTKQEEIRDWDKGLTEVEKVLCSYARAVSDVGEDEDKPMTNSMMRKEWGRLLMKVQQDLSALGVVVKVDRELPLEDLKRLSGSAVITWFNQAGYVAVEPLTGGSD